MLSSIASYLFGSGSDDAQPEAVPSGKDQETLTAIETDGDWMLVEKNDKSPTVSSDEDGCREQSLAERRRRRNRRHFHHTNNNNNQHPHQHQHPGHPTTNTTISGPISLRTQPSLPSLAASSVAALYSLSGGCSPTSLLEGSWYITPPPCFTAGGPNAAFQVAQSPLENLLIEHPSMSVYDNFDLIDYSSPAVVALVAATNAKAIADAAKEAGTSIVPYGRKCSRRGGRRVARDPYGLAATTRGALSNKSTGGSSNGNNSRDENRLVVGKEMDGATAAVVANNENDATAANLRAAAPRVTGKSAQLMLLLSQSEGQKVKQREQVKLLHRKQLERLNKVQEFESVGKKQRRKDFMRSPSGKSNNRKY